MKSAMMNGYKVNLVQSLEDLQYAKDYIRKVVGIDTETSGLNYITDTIAGYCFAGGSPIQGFYYPVRHLIGKNLPIEPIVEYMQYCLDNKKCMLFNKSFDFSMMEKDCINIPLRGDHHDVQVMVWEATNEKFPGLKPSCKAYLKFEMIEFSDVAGSVGYNFRETDPELSFMYAAFDPVATVLLGRKFWNDFPYIRKIYPVDNLCTEVARRMGKIDIKLDYDILRKSLEQEEKVLRELRNKAHQLAGYEFNVGCYSDDTEFLTKVGFKRYDEIKSDDEIAQYNPDTDDIEYVIPTDRVLAVADRTILFKNSKISMQVTENHRMWSAWNNYPYKIKRADSLLNGMFNTKVCWKHEGIERVEPFVFDEVRVGNRVYDKSWSFDADTFIEYLGMYLADGHAGVHDKANTLTLVQSTKDKKSETLSWLRGLNTRMGHFFNESEDKSREIIQFQKSNKNVCAYLIEVSQVDGVKRIPKFVYDLSYRQRMLYLEAFLRGDGSYNCSTCSILHASNKDLIDDFQILCAGLGLRTNPYQFKRKKNSSIRGVSFIGEPKGCMSMSVSSKSDHVRVTKSNVYLSSDSKRVVCFSVPTGLLVTRKDGYIAISGNSNRDKAEALNRFVNLTQKTKTGQFCVKDEVLQNIDHPLAQTILAYSKQVKYISSFIKALLAIEGKPFYSNMKLTAVPCLTKHNFVVLRHRGLVSISEVAAGDEILTRFGWKRVLHSESKWSDFVVAFSTKSDIGLEGTGHHPVLVKTEDGEKWKDIQCLEKGEKAVTLESYPCGGLEIVANQIKDKLSSNLLSFDDAAFVHVALKYICVWSKLKATESNCYLFITNEGIERLRRWGITRLSSNVLIEEHEDSYDIDWISLKEPDEDDDQYGDYVYDIEVEDVHEYVANGIVTHNTGRFATGKVKGNPYYAEVNIMGIKKEKMKRYLHYEESLPCKYFLDDNPEGAIGKQEVKAGTRDAFIAPEGYYFYTSDYKSEELALGGNLCMSGETEVTLKSGKAKLKDIVRGDVVLTPLGYRIVEERFDVGEKEAWRVTLEDGRQFECSPYHVFLVMSSSVLQFKELQYIDLEIDELLTENDEVNERDFKTALHNFRSTSE